MAKVKPFKGIRPPKELIEKVASRPYDVLNSEEARKEAEGNEMSLYHIIKPEIDFPAGTDEHSEPVYAKAVLRPRQRCLVIAACLMSTLAAIRATATDAWTWSGRNWTAWLPIL
jgi:hypothetical protein